MLRLTADGGVDGLMQTKRKKVHNTMLVDLEHVLFTLSRVAVYGLTTNIVTVRGFIKNKNKSNCYR